MRFDSHVEALLSAAVALVNVTTPGYDGTARVPAQGLDDPSAVGGALLSGGRPASLTATEAGALASHGATVREVFAASAAGERDVAAALVNRLLLETGARPQLDPGPEGWGLHFHGSDDGVVVGWSAGIAAGLAICVGSDLAGALGVCAADPCDRVFVDTSKNGTRRFCSTRCQNRIKAAAHRARSSAPPVGPDCSEDPA